VRGRDDVWVVELLIRYDGGPWNYGVEILEFRGDKVAHESIYVMEGWEAPEWRAPRRAAPPHEPDGEPVSQSPRASRRRTSAVPDRSGHPAACWSASGQRVVYLGRAIIGW
jgi:hypothetical protein